MINKLRLAIKKLLGPKATKTFFAAFYLLCILYTFFAITRTTCTINGNCQLHFLYLHVSLFVLASSAFAFLFNIAGLIFWEKYIAKLCTAILMAANIYLVLSLFINPNITLSYFIAIGDRIFISLLLCFCYLYRTVYLMNQIDASIKYQKKLEKLNQED